MGINNECSNDIQYLISTRMISREYQVNRFMTRWGQNLQCPPGGREQKMGSLIPHLPSFYRSFYRTEEPAPIWRENIQYQQVYIITVFVKYFTTLMFS